MKPNSILVQFKGLSSERVAHWVIENYPKTSNNYFDVFNLIPHLSLKKKQRKDLAFYYLSKRYVTDSPYCSFLKIMPTSEFFGVINNIIKNDTSNIDIGLLMYQLDVLFRLNNPHIQNRKEDFELWRDFKNKILMECTNKVPEAA